MNILNFLNEHNINGFDNDGGTDKCSLHSYGLNIYPKILSPLVNKKCSILELGSYKGGWGYTLIKMLPHSSVTCVDIENHISQNTLSRFTDDETSRFRFVQADAYSEQTIISLGDEKYDVIFEDGPHTIQTQIFTAVRYSHLLKEDGTLIIEDIPDDGCLRAIMDSVDRERFTCESVDLRSVLNRFDDLVVIIKRKAQSA